MFDTLRNDIEFLAYAAVGYLAIVAFTRKAWCNLPIITDTEGCKNAPEWGWTPIFRKKKEDEKPTKPPYKSDPDYHPKPAPEPVATKPPGGGADFTLKCAGGKTICEYPPTNLYHTLSNSGRDCKEEFTYMCNKGWPRYCVNQAEIRISCPEVEV